MIHDRSAYEKLTKEYGLYDERASPYNVLIMRAYKFERIFVFSNEISIEEG